MCIWRNMGKQQHFAGLHLIRWYRYEPVYRWEHLLNHKPSKHSVSEPQTVAGDKAVVQLSERVYDKKTGRTAVISDVSAKTLTLKFDDNGNTSEFYRSGKQGKAWIVNVPFKSARSFPPLFAKVLNVESYTCIRFGNIVEPSGIEGYLLPCTDIEGEENGFFVESEEAVITDEFNQFKESLGTRYILRAHIPENNSGTETWKEYFIKCIEEFKKLDVNYIAIPYVYDLWSCVKTMSDMAKIAFEAVTEWMYQNPDYSIQAVFLCTSIHEYREYKEVLRRHINIEKLE